MQAVPSLRIRNANDAPVNADGEYVLYWMTANRRLRYNFSLQHALNVSDELGKPLIIFEALRCGYRWASDRLHRFVMQGMADHRAALDNSSVRYYCWLETSEGEGSGLLEALTDEACAVVSDDFPCFFLPRMYAAVADRLKVRLELVDSNGILPMTATDRVFTTAASFRRYLQKELRPHLVEFPNKNPLRGVDLPQARVPAEILHKWPEASDKVLTATPEELAEFPIDHDVKPAAFDGGDSQARKTLQRFLKSRLDRYADGRNDPDEEAASGLSPYLHFGHISAHEVFRGIADRNDWSVDDLAEQASGSREGWWGMDGPSESFLDELITWRELGYNMSSKRDDYDQLDSLPDWALKTIDEHADDPRPDIYTPEEMEKAQTSDEIWNAAQRQLVSDGRMHNYLRMLWGKKIYQWSETAADALEVMIDLNNKYAVDGRNPNSYSGIFWVLGRYDRAWGPERDIFGKLRYMTSDSTRRKLKLSKYLEKYSAESQGQLW